MSLVAFGISPDEVWDIEFVPDRLRRTIRKLRERGAALEAQAARLPEAERTIQEETTRGLAAQAEALTKELSAYVPGSGPIFTIGPIPNAVRAEIGGEAWEVSRLDGAEMVKRDMAWAEKVVRWTVRGHRNLLNRRGEAISFEAELIDWDGRKRSVPARATLEAYQLILGDLALLAVESQVMNESTKNG